MIYYIHGATALITAALIFAIVYMVRHPSDHVYGKITQSDIVGWFGIFFGVIMDGMQIFFMITKETTSEMWFYIGIAVFCLCWVLAYRNWRITYDEVGFTHRNILGISHRYSYDEVTCYKHSKLEKRFAIEIRLYMGRRFVMVREGTEAVDAFMHIVRKRYRMYHGGKDLPKL